MTTPRNDCRSLFKTNSLKKDCFHKKLKLSDSDRKILISAKSEIRTAIRAGFNELKTIQKRNDLKAVSTPLFAPQGSFVYGTLNNPAYPPRQQLDLDYGVYLPFSDLAGGNAPKQTTGAFFKIVEEILENHIETKRKGQWRLITDKSTCVRVVINSTMHIDLPLYGCPDKELFRVVEAAANEKIARIKNRAFDQADSGFEKIDSQFIHLADRKKGWIVSDPLVIRDWVDALNHAFGAGNHFKDVSRYLKAWRDEVPDWCNGGGPSSILILALTAELYSTNENGVHAQLAEVIEGLNDRLLNPPVNIPAPGQPNDEENLLSRVSFDELQDIRTKISALEWRYREAMQTEDVNESNRLLIEIFGSRFPRRPEDIKQKSTADIVREAPAIISPAKFPKTATSG